MFGGGGGGIGMMGTGYPYSTGMYPTYGAGYAGGLGMAGSVAQQPVLGTATQQQQHAGTNGAATPPKELHPQINLTTIIRFLTESAAVFEGLRMVLQVIRSWGSEVLGFGQTGPLAGVLLCQSCFGNGKAPSGWSSESQSGSEGPGLMGGSS